MRTAILTVAILLLVAPTAFADTDEGLYKKLWAKYATAFSEKPKVGCVCLDASFNNFKLGAVRRIGSDAAACYIPAFNADGALIAQALCEGGFVPLAK